MPASPAAQALEPDEGPADDPRDAASPLVLRVLAGRARGAEAALTLGATVTIGHDLDGDLVLRDPSAKGVKLRLTPASPSTEVEVLAGEIKLLGHALAAPARALLPTYLPLIIGDNAAVMKLAARLEREGLRVPGIRPPTVPMGEARLRITLCATHTRADIERLVQALATAAAEASAS